jgi:hypothetical protein
MKTCCLFCLLAIFCFPLSMNAKDVPLIAPTSTELASESMSGKTDTEQLELLALWKKEPLLLKFCKAQLDALYARNKSLIEQYAQSSMGDSIVRACCFEILRRHRNFAVALPPQEIKLTMPITGYELTHNPGLIEFRREWALYRIEAAPNPQAKLEELREQEPQNKIIFDLITTQNKSDAKAPETKPTLATPSEAPTSSTPWSVVAVIIVAAIGLLWLLLKNRK